MAEGTLEDLSGKIKVMWFNQAYIARMIHEGSNVKLTGKVTEGKSGIYLSNPEFEKAPDIPIDSHSSLFGDGEEANEVFGYPIYAETKAVTSKWLYHGQYNPRIHDLGYSILFGPKFLFQLLRPLKTG